MRDMLLKDFFQILRPGLQLLRPPKRDARDGPGVVAGFVAYNYDAFMAEYSIEPWQAGRWCLLTQCLLSAHGGEPPPMLSCSGPMCWPSWATTRTTCLA